MGVTPTKIMFVIILSFEVALVSSLILYLLPKKIKKVQGKEKFLILQIGMDCSNKK